MSPGYQNMKTGPDALRIPENQSGRAKHENVTRRHRYRRNRVRERKTYKRDPTHSVHPKTSPSAKKMKRDLTHSTPLKMRTGAQNMKTGLDAVGTAENESERAKYENSTPRPRYR
jgi:hypothetical protein